MENKDKPFVVSHHDVALDSEYVQWFSELKDRYHRSQIKAAVKVNSEKLLFNWQLGRDLSQRKAVERWGTGIVERVSLDLQKAFPGEGFSVRTVQWMKQWYEFYTCNTENLQKVKQVASQLQNADQQTITKLNQVGSQIQEDSGLGLAFPTAFSFVPWRHHIVIIQRCKSVDEALYYIRKTIDGSWSRSVLEHHIKNDDYHKQASAINNFHEVLPLPQASLAEEMSKENYDFGFISLPEGFSERQLEDALSQRITDLLLEMGTGFAFLGRQKEIVVSGTTRKIDLLFYHIHLRCYIVCELLCCAQHNRSIKT